MTGFDDPMAQSGAIIIYHIISDSSVLQFIIRYKNSKDFTITFNFSVSGR